MANAKRDGNFITVMQGVDSTLFVTPVDVAVNPTTHALITEANEGLGVPGHDYVSMALSAADTTETYVFKTGGSGGSTVATIVVVYTTSARDILSSVTKT